MNKISSLSQLPRHAVLQFEKSDEDMVKVTGIEQLSKTTRALKGLAALSLWMMTAGFFKKSLTSSLWEEARVGKVKIEARIEIGSLLINEQIEKINRLQPVLMIQSNGKLMSANQMNFSDFQEGGKANSKTFNSNFLFLKNKSIKENQAFIFDYILSSDEKLDAVQLKWLIEEFDLWSNLDSLQYSDKIALAKELAKTNLSAFISKFASFQITKQEDVVEIAEFCVKENVKLTTRDIRAFGAFLALQIADQKNLIKIIRLCALKNAESVIKNFRIFKINDEQDRIEIAKQLACLDAKNVAEHFDNFAITNYEARLQIAKICCRAVGFHAIKHINNFQIKELDMPEIATAWAQGANQYRAASYVKMLNLTELQDRKKFFAYCVIQDPTSFEFSPRLKLNSNFNDFLNKSPQDAEAFLSKAFGDSISPYLQKNIPSVFLACAFLLIDTQSDQNQEFIKKELLKAYIELKSPQQRLNLLPLIDSIPTQFSALSCDETAKQEEYLEPIKLLRLLLAQIGFKDADSIKKFYIGKWRNYIRNAKDLIFLLQTLLLLKQDPAVNAEEKQAIVRKILSTQNSTQLKSKFDAKATKDKQSNQEAPAPQALISSLYILLQFNNYEALKSEAATWPALAQQTFKELFQLKSIENFSKKYAQTFLACRYPEAILVYALKLKTLNEETVMQALAAYVTSVLNGTFKEDRYSLKNNLHLETIDRHFPMLIQEWKKSSIEQLELTDSNQINYLTSDLKKDERLIDTDDPIALLLSGKSMGSCQTFEGDVEKTKGLLGAFDGKTRMLAIIDPSSQLIKARGLIKLLWDGKQPVILLEPFYPRNKICKAHKNALLKLAKAKASALKLPLVYAANIDIGHKEPGRLYPKRLCSMQGAQPYEYSDAARGVKKNGIYEVERVIQIN